MSAENKLSRRDFLRAGALAAAGAALAGCQGGGPEEPAEEVTATSLPPEKERTVGPKPTEKVIKVEITPVPPTPIPTKKPSPEPTSIPERKATPTAEVRAGERVGRIEGETLAFGGENLRIVEVGVEEIQEALDRRDFGDRLDNVSQIEILVDAQRQTAISAVMGGNVEKEISPLAVLMATVPKVVDDCEYQLTGEALAVWGLAQNKAGENEIRVFNPVSLVPGAPESPAFWVTGAANAVLTYKEPVDGKEKETVTFLRDNKDIWHYNPEWMGHIAAFTMDKAGKSWEKTTPEEKETVISLVSRAAIPELEWADESQAAIVRYPILEGRVNLLEDNKAYLKAAEYSQKKERNWVLDSAGFLFTIPEVADFRVIDEVVGVGETFVWKTDEGINYWDWQEKVVKIVPEYRPREDLEKAPSMNGLRKKVETIELGRTGKEVEIETVVYRAEADNRFGLKEGVFIGYIHPGGGYLFRKEEAGLEACGKKEDVGVIGLRPEVLEVLLDEAGFPEKPIFTLPFDISYADDPNAPVGIMEGGALFGDDSSSVNALYLSLPAESGLVNAFPNKEGLYDEKGWRRFRISPQKNGVDLVVCDQVELFKVGYLLYLAFPEGNNLEYEVIKVPYGKKILANFRLPKQFSPEMIEHVKQTSCSEIAEKVNLMVLSRTTVEPNIMFLKLDCANVLTVGRTPAFILDEDNPLLAS